MVAMRKNCFIKDSFKELEDLQELDTGSAAPEREPGASRAPVQHSQGVGRDQLYSRCVFQKNIADTVRFTSSVMAFGGHGHIVCSDLIFFH